MSEIVSRADRAAAYADVLRTNYEKTTYWTSGWPHLNPPLPPAGETYRRLKALGDRPNPDLVDEICRERVTFADCDECGEEADIVVAFEDDISAVEICGPCCAALARKISGRKISGLWRAMIDAALAD